MSRIWSVANTLDSVLVGCDSLLSACRGSSLDRAACVGDYVLGARYTSSAYELVFLFIVRSLFS